MFLPNFEAEFKKKKKKEKCPMHSYIILLVCDWNSLQVEKGNIFYSAFIKLCVYLYNIYFTCDRSPLSPSGAAGSHTLPLPASPGATGSTFTTPPKKTHQRSKSDATAAITASSRLMQVSDK